MSNQNPEPEPGTRPLIVVDEAATLLADAPPMDAKTRRRLRRIMRTVRSLSPETRRNLRQRVTITPGDPRSRVIVERP